MSDIQTENQELADLRSQHRLQRPNVPLSRPYDHDEIKRIKAQLAEMGCIALIWSIKEVQIGSIAPHLSDEQSFQVLQEVEDNHDADWGVCRQTLRDTVEYLFDDGEEGYEDE